MGSLALANARFIFAEVAAALNSVHDAGFAYGDLKPENILITSSGHAKLTDFGAARPLPDSKLAVAALSGAGDVIQDLRDGDWAAQGRESRMVQAGADEGLRRQTECQESGSCDSVLSECDGKQHELGERFEGTTVYLAPELVSGGRPDIMSDIWAFGCTLYQALCGRPPLWAESHTEVVKRIVRFERMDEDAYPEQVPPLARELIGLLLKPDIAERLGSGRSSYLARGHSGEPCSMDSLLAVRNHPFFEGLDGNALYSAHPPPLAGGAAMPQPHAAWSRRQNSVMWSPLPQRYTFGDDDSSMLRPLTEGSEAAASFTRSTPTMVQAMQAAAALHMPPPRLHLDGLQTSSAIKE